jgi:hypothetical protein
LEWSTVNDLFMMVLGACRLRVFQVRVGAKREQMTFGFYPTLAGSFT